MGDFGIYNALIMVAIGTIGRAVVTFWKIIYSFRNKVLALFITFQSSHGIRSYMPTTAHQDGQSQRYWPATMHATPNLSIWIPSITLLPGLSHSSDAKARCAALPDLESQPLDGELKMHPSHINRTPRRYLHLFLERHFFHNHFGTKRLANRTN